MSRAQEILNTETSNDSIGVMERDHVVQAMSKDRLFSIIILGE